MKTYIIDENGVIVFLNKRGFSTSSRLPKCLKAKTSSIQKKTGQIKKSTCPVCNQKVRRLTRHLNKAHPNHASIIHNNGSNNTKKTSSEGGSAQTHKTININPSSPPQRCSENTSRYSGKVQNTTTNLPYTTNLNREKNQGQFSSDGKDGGKYLGYMQRENGRFGSLPLYDDYSEDSTSD